MRSRPRGQPSKVTRRHIPKDVYNREDEAVWGWAVVCIHRFGIGRGVKRALLSSGVSASFYSSLEVLESGRTFAFLSYLWRCILKLVSPKMFILSTYSLAICSKCYVPFCTGQGTSLIA